MKCNVNSGKVFSLIVSIFLLAGCSNDSNPEPKVVGVSDVGTSKLVSIASESILKEKLSENADKRGITFSECPALISNDSDDLITFSNLRYGKRHKAVFSFPEYWKNEFYEYSFGHTSEAKQLSEPASDTKFLSDPNSEIFQPLDKNKGIFIWIEMIEESGSSSMEGFSNKFEKNTYHEIFKELSQAQISSYRGDTRYASELKRYCYGSKNELDYYLTDYVANAPIQEGKEPLRKLKIWVIQDAKAARIEYEAPLKIYNDYLRDIYSILNTFEFRDI